MKTTRPLTRATLVLAAPVLALALAGCSSGAEHVIAIDSLKWTPAEIEIEVGDTVVWDMTSSGMPHDVVSDDGLFASELVVEGEFRYTFDEAGEFGFHCTPHPMMVGTVTVVEPS